MTEQTKRESFIETNVNTWVGLIGSFIITMLCNWLLMPIIGMFWTTLASVALCTLWSIFRGYHIRRYFESRRIRKAVEYKFNRQPPF